MVKTYLNVWLGFFYLTVEHILIECGDFAEVRQRYDGAKNLQQLLQEISVTNIFAFLQEIGLFYRILKLLVHNDL